MTRTLRGTLSAASVLPVAFVGCNAILDNRPGTLAETEEPGPDGPTSPDASVMTPVTPVTPTPVTPTDAGGGAPPDAGAHDAGALMCPDGQQTCDGACVSPTDPFYGCGDPSCTPCPAASRMGCEGNRCVPAALACDVGMPLRCGAECVDPLTNAKHCGACNVACPLALNATSTCAGGACTFTCGAAFHLCGGACVPRTDATRCGAACTACPVPPGGAAACVADACGVACGPGLRQCKGSCTSTNDPSACGPACAVCPGSANATATCVADACALTCNPGFADCDANPANGCETQLGSDANHCGLCGRACRVPPVCVNGACLLGF